MNNGILVVDDDDAHRGMLRTMLRSWGYTVDEAADGDEAVALVREKAFDVVLTDVRMARMDGIHALKGILEYNPALPVVLMTAYSSVETAVEALRLGAYDYLVKPLDFEALKHTLEQAIEHSRLSVENRELRRQQAGDKQLSYRSAAMQSVMSLIQTVAPTDVTVLITGESGTGKELVANELYQQSDRRGKPFIKVNCAAIPSELLESELFGYEEGAFTGAKRAGKAGMFELANTGVILLDEIGDMPLPLQAKLLRVLQQRELVRLGGSRVVKLDIRVIASTNKDLREQVRQGGFREDLYYRLNVVPIALKPLRERKEDIVYLADQFCRNFDKKYGKDAHISPGGMELLLEYPWPGNIRELENLVERIVVTSSGALINRDSVFAALSPGGLRFGGDGQEGATLKRQVAAFEREVILHTIEREGSLRRAARALGVDHSTLVKKRRQYEMEEAHPDNR